MSTETFISKLDTIIRLLREQTLAQKQVFNSRDAALYLKCSLRHLYRLTGKNKIPCYKVDGRRLFFSHIELQHWLLSEKKTAAIVERKPSKPKSADTKTQ